MNKTVPEPQGRADVSIAAEFNNTCMGTTAESARQQITRLPKSSAIGHHETFSHDLDPRNISYTSHANSYICYYPARACVSRGLCDRGWCPYICR